MKGSYPQGESQNILGGVAQKVSAWLQEYQWLVIGILGVLTVGLGTWGFYQFGQGGQDQLSWIDSFYLALQLFTLESGSAAGPKPLSLQVARFLAPALLAYATIRAAVALFREQWRRCRLPFWRHHVVVCGLGEKGRRLVEEFLQRGERVVAVDKDEANSNIPSCGEHGALVLVGDAANPLVLQKARIHRAKHLIAVTGDDGVNVEIAVQAQNQIKAIMGSRTPVGPAPHCCWGSGRGDLAPPWAGGLAPRCDGWCYVHLQETNLKELVGGNELFTGPEGSCPAKFFDIYENAARLVFRKHPPDTFVSDPYRDEIHLLIIGFGRMGESIALQAARQGHYASGKPVRLTVVDAEATRQLNLFLYRYPKFPDICELSWADLRLEDPEFLRFQFLGDLSERRSPTMIFVCLEDEKQGLLGAKRLLKAWPTLQVPILVRVRSLTGFARLVQEGITQTLKEGRIFPFGSIGETCSLKLVLDEELDILAKANHALYVSHMEKRGKTAATRPAMAPWPVLREDYKDSNRQQAEHLAVKLRTLGCELQDLQPGETPGFDYYPEEIELLARMEHNRWNAERWLAGWNWCSADIDEPTRASQKLNPYLVPYEDLPDEIKEYDRDHARDIPVILSLIGKKMVRTRPVGAISGGSPIPGNRPR